MSRKQKSVNALHGLFSFSLIYEDGREVKTFYVCQRPARAFLIFTAENTV